jgi:Protein of unknown function (DUF2855)
MSDPAGPPGAAAGLDFEVRRSDLSTTRVIAARPPRPPAGTVLFEVERFGFSANNITYALLGERRHYWALFPAGDGWGRIPVWAYLRAVAGQVPGIEPGRRAYGLCPMSTHLLVVPERVSGTGFVDAAPHRSRLSPVYNAYAWLDADPAYDPCLEDELLVLRPVFWLSFLVDDHLAAAGLLDRQILLTSASSKAAIGIAHLLSRRGVPTVGLTSARHRDVVDRLGCYRQVRAYEEVGSLPAAPAALVDVAGDQALRQRIARHYGSALAHTVTAGFTHREAGSAGSDTTFLFVPDRIVECARETGWPDLGGRYAHALRDFAASATRWLRVGRARGPAGVEGAYRRVLTDRATPAEAHVLALA